MPSEDSIEEEDIIIKQNEKSIEIENEEIQTIGLIRNVKGLIYLELDEMLEINDNYLKVFWWFDKLDKPKLRENTMCNPPYENAPQSVVFATRSPVRPNLIAMTIVKVIKKEGRMIYVNGIEGFDKTPLIGLCGYDKNISDILNLTIIEALEFFDFNNEIYEKLKFLKKVGLAYLKIVDTTSSLSGGEASRLKLAKELMKGKKKNTLYLLDEPTIGLHFSDIDNLLLIINELAKDNTILTIEHNKQFLLNSDYYIELGPGAGALSGEVIYQGNELRKK